MKKTLITLVLGLSMITAHAQDYTSAIGLRGGFYRGITYKHFFSEKVAFEGLLTTRYRGINLTGLVEFHNAVGEVDGLKWYYGFGAHAGYYDTYYYYSYYYNNDNYEFFAGVDGIIGIEYTFDFIPINLSLDWKPSFDLIGGDYFNADAGALSIRYCFE